MRRLDGFLYNKDLRQELIKTLSHIYDSAFLTKIVNKFLQKISTVNVWQSYDSASLCDDHFSLAKWKIKRFTDVPLSLSLKTSENLSDFLTFGRNSVYWEVWNENDSQFNLLCLIYGKIYLLDCSVFIIQ